MKNMGEFDLIKRYFTLPPQPSDFVQLGIGDDAAILTPNAKKRLAVSMDTLVVDSHFKSSWPPSAIAHRAMAANLSDMAAMGAKPKAMLLSLSLPEVDEKWLSEFSTTLTKQLIVHNVLLIGGDTVKGPMAVTITIIGELNNDKALTRCGAKVGDTIYISGSLGDCAYALTQLEKEALSSDIFSKLFYPVPKVNLAQSILPFAHSAIDISDGLLQDLSHLLAPNKLGADIFLNQLPIGKVLAKAQLKNRYELALSSGEEYELCFLISAKKRPAFEQHVITYQLDCQAIGVIKASSGVCLVDEKGSKEPVDVRGYQHF